MKTKNFRRTTALFFSLSLMVTTMHGQTYQQTANGVKVQIGCLDVDLQFYSPSIVRVMKSPEGEKMTKKSFSVIKTPEKTHFKVK